VGGIFPTTRGNDRFFSEKPEKTRMPRQASRVGEKRTVACKKKRRPAAQKEFGEGEGKGVGTKRDKKSKKKGRNTTGDGKTCVEWSLLGETTVLKYGERHRQKCLGSKKKNKKGPH